MRRDPSIVNEPPIYRKLLYQDDGSGLAVPTKAFSGLVGALFCEAGEKELEQFVHWIRPLLVAPEDEDGDPMKHASLLTDVPTEIPIDEVVRFEELADPISAMLPVPEQAIEFLDTVRATAAGNGPDGFNAETLLERDDEGEGTVANKVAAYHTLATLAGLNVTERTVRNWIDDLEAIGLLRPDEDGYEQRRGVSYIAEVSTLKSELSVISSNSGFEVATKRLLRQKLTDTPCALDWIAWAQEACGLGGDRCGWDPPPDPAG